MPPRASRANRTSLRVEALRLRRVPLAAAALAFALGIASAHLSPKPVTLLLAAFMLMATLTVGALIWAPRAAPWAALGCWTVLGMGALMWQPVPVASDALLPFGDGLSRVVEGTVMRIEPPASVFEQGDAGRDADAVPVWEAAEDTADQRGRPLAIDVEVQRIEQVTPDVSSMVPMEGGIHASIYQPEPYATPLHCGDVVRMTLRLRAPQPFGDPGAFSYSELEQTKGILLAGNTTGNKVERSGAGRPSWSCRLAAAQAWSAGRLQTFVDSPENKRLPEALRLDGADAGMLSAMLFGDRAGLGRRLRQGFERTGSFHLFVVSGVHIALLAGWVYFLLQKANFRPVLATLTTIFCTTFYAAVTGFGQPAQRALAMTSIFLVARLLSRERSALNALGAAVLLMLAWNPRSLFEASLQMTALAILAIGGIAVPLGEWTVLRYASVTRQVFTRSGRLAPSEAALRLRLELWGEALAGILGDWAKRMPALFLRVLFDGGELALVGVVAELVLVLPMAVYFHRAAVLAVPANLIVLPLIGVLLPAAVLTFAASLVSSWLALLPGTVTALLLHTLSGGIRRVSHFTVADVRVAEPAGWVGLLALAGWLACCWLVRRSHRGAWLTALALPAIAALVLWPEPMRRAPGKLEVTALDVGQGDSVLVVGPDGRTMLVDAGGPVGRGGNAAPVARFDVGEQVVAPYLWSRRLRRLDVLVLTHAHTDHMGGMPAILADFRPRELWVSIQPDSALFRDLLAEAAAYGVLVKHYTAGDLTSLGAVSVRVLSPAVGYGNRGAPKNDDSLVMELRYGKAGVLLEGDAEKPSEDAMLAAGLVQPVTLLKVGHHGSKTSSEAAFLAAARPRDSVISVGRHNTFGHPRGEVLTRLGAAGVRTYRTDLMGGRTFLLGADGELEERGWRQEPWD